MRLKAWIIQVDQSFSGSKHTQGLIDKVEPVWLGQNLELWPNMIIVSGSCLVVLDQVGLSLNISFLCQKGNNEFTLIDQTLIFTLPVTITHGAIMFPPNHIQQNYVILRQVFILIQKGIMGLLYILDRLKAKRYCMWYVSKIWYLRCV